MNSIKNNSKLSKFLKNAFKRLKGKIAVFLALSMVLTLVLPYVGVLNFNLPNVALADGTELQAEFFPAENRKSNTTVVKWKGSSVIDFKGKTRSTDTYDSGFQTTYMNGGYAVNFNVNTVAMPDNGPPASGGQSGTFNQGNGGVYTLGDVEFKVITQESPNKKYVFMDLYAYNKANQDKYVALRFSSDTQITNNDYARVVVNRDDQIFHVVNDNLHNNSTCDYVSFDIIAHDDDYHLDPFNVALAAYYNSRDDSNYAWREYAEYYTGHQQTDGSYDSGVSFGWKNIKVRPYEIIHRRVAFMARTATYYVNAQYGKDNPGSAADGSWPAWQAGDLPPSQPGAFDKPFKTIQKALDVIGNKKAFICLQTDCTLPNEVNINNSQKDITIQSTDIGMNARKNTQKFTLTCNNSKVNVSNGRLTFSDLVISSNGNDKQDVFIEQTGGYVTFSSGTTFSGFKNSKGAAVLHTINDGRIALLGTTIQNCVSADKVTIIDGKPATTSCCAITYEGYTGTDTDLGFEMNGNNQIWNNGDENYIYNETTDTWTGNRRNVYLANEKYICASNLLKNEVSGIESKVSISTEKLPTPYIGAVKASDEEVIVVKPASDYPQIAGINNCPFEQYFLDDRTNSNNRIAIAEGKYTGRAKFAVVKQLGSRITFRYVNENGSTLQGISRANMIVPVGKNLTIEASPSELTGYEMDSCQVIGNGFTIDNVKTSDTFGTATGTMGTTNVEIRYIFKAKDVTYTFVSNGGIPETIPPIEGQAGKRVSGILSTLKKYGYLFAGWYDNITDPYDTGNTGKVTSLPTVFPTTGQVLYAKYNIDTTISIPVAESHTNADGSIVFYGTPDDQVLPSGSNRNVEMPIRDYQGNQFTSKPVPGYNPSLNDSTVNPERYIYRSAEEPVGAFALNAGTVTFDGRTPGQQTTLTFKYNVDPTQNFTLRSEFYKVNSHGTNPEPISIGGNTFIENSYNAETAVEFTPTPRTGFNIIRGEIASGGTDIPTSYQYKVTGSFDEHNNYKFSGRMPNQNVVLKYYYQSTANDREFIIDYKDSDTLDNRYESIIDSIITEKNYEDSIEADKQDRYGYTFYESEVIPAQTPPVGTFDATTQHFTGTMPLNQAVTVTYKYHRNDFFKNIVYKESHDDPNCTTTFDVSGLSPDLTVNGSGNPTTKVLSNSASGTGWTFADLRTRELIPQVTTSDPILYAVDGFFVDMNGNGIYDAGTDRMLTDTDVFTTSDIGADGNITIVPHIRVLFENITISFTSDGNATINTTGITTNYRSIDTWQTALYTGVPDTSTAGYYYVFDAWYLNNVAVQPTDLLVNGGTYVAKFRKDTSMADAPKKVLFNTSIDNIGNGQINVRDAHVGYGYILAGEDNVIISKVLATGTTFSYTHDLDGVDINTKYNLYEVKIDNTVTYDSFDVGDNITTLDAAHLGPQSFCYVPAVIKNYEVSVDATQYSSGNENVAKVKIKPTSVDYEYAIYDGSAMATGTEWLVGEVNGITFEGLVAGKTYRVVTKKHQTGAITDTQGTNIYLDTLYNLTANSYVVTVINGTVNGGDNTAIVESGATVNISSSATGTDFDRWQVLSGGVAVASATSETTSFTMPARNVIVIAKKPVTLGNNITVTNAQYGTADYNVYMDSSDVDSIITTLAGNPERYLANHGFSIKYNVTYDKNILSFEEQTALEGAMGGEAARGAIAIDVDVDRYLDGKRVDSDAFTPAPLTGSSLVGAENITVDEITNLFGDSVLEHAPGLESYLNGEINAPTAATEDTSVAGTVSTDEEPEEDATTLAEMTTTVVENQTTVSEEATTVAENQTTVSENSTTVVASSDSVGSSTDNVVANNDSVGANFVSPDEPTTVEANNDSVGANNDSAGANEDFVGANSVSPNTDAVGANTDPDFVGANFVSPDEPTTVEATEPEEDLAPTEGTVSGFTGSFDQIEPSENANEGLDYGELVENLMLFGSDFSTPLQVNTFVTLHSTDLNNGEYKVYRSDAGLTEVPSVLTISEEAGKKGVIGFNAEKGRRYIIAYNRYNDITLINENPGLSETIAGAITRVTFRVKYGDNLSAIDSSTLPTLDDYAYQRATYANGEYSYKRTTKEQFNLTDPIRTGLTIYVVYDTDAANIAALMADIEAALERARRLLDNYFLLLDEKNDIRAKANALEALVANETSTSAELLASLTELEAVLNVVEPRLEVREANYQRQDTRKNKTTSTYSGGSSYSGGGGSGGGGGGGGGAVSANAAEGLAGPGSFATMTPEQEALNQQAILTQQVLPGATQNIPVVPASVSSRDGMVKVDFNESISSFVRGDGSLAKSEWINTNYGWYHANVSGALDTGWNKFGNDWFYFYETNVNNSKNLMHIGWLQNQTASGTNTYYMSANGSMMVGYQVINGLTYYFNVEDKIGAPLGSMLVNAVTPDGRTAGADGVVR